MLTYLMDQLRNAPQLGGPAYGCVAKAPNGPRVYKNRGPRRIVGACRIAVAPRANVSSAVCKRGIVQ
jgi:hypothetical protein